MPEEIMSFEAILPQDAASPVKPTRDFSPATQKRRVRLWLDCYLDPGQTERLLLLGDESFVVSISRE